MDFFEIISVRRGELKRYTEKSTIEMPYADLHLHLGSKAVFANRSEINHCWKRYSIPDAIVDHMFDSQSSLDQFTGNGDWRLVCCSLHPPEVESLRYWGFRLFARLGKDFSVARLDTLRAMPYFTVLEEEMEMLMKSFAMANPALRLKHIRTMNDYDQTPGVLNVLFTVEGGHAFFKEGIDGTEPIEDILARLNAFIASFSPVAINLCHFQTHALALQAFAFNFRTYQANHRALFPQGTGLSGNGHKFIETCLGNGVLVDLKHMGLSARREFYEEYPDVPLLATHVGVTGLRSTDELPIRSRTLFRGRCMRVVYNKPKGHLTKTYFNPISINLYDDDIEVILRSNGLIALSLDQRIIGASEPLFFLDHVKRKEREFISLEDMALFGGEWPISKAFVDEIEVIRTEGELDEDDEVEVDDLMLSELMINKSEALSKDKSDSHPDFLANQIVHIAKVAHEHGLAWQEHIAIGSDMDGLINALDHCTTVEHFAKLESALRNSMDSSAVRAAIPEPYDANDLVDGIMHRNAIAFLKRNAFGGWKNTPSA